MKKILRFSGPVVAAMGMALVAVGCGDKEEPGAGADSTDNGKDSDSGGSPAIEEPIEQGDGGSTSLEDKIFGYWVPDADATKKTLDETITGNPEGLAAAKALMDPILSSMTLQVLAQGRIVTHFAGVPQPSTYAVKSVNAAASTLEVEITNGGKVENAEFIVEGDRLTFSRNGETLILNRADEATFKKRQRIPANAPAIPGFPGQPEGGAPEPSQQPARD